MHKTAVADEKFRSALTCDPQANEEDKIVLTAYQPNKLIYSSSTTQDRIAVFSEIYYPEGWHLYVDGEEKEIGRVNYVLRAAIIPAGEHTIQMEFVPDAIGLDKWSYACAILLLLIALGGITYPIWEKRLKQQK